MAQVALPHATKEFLLRVGLPRRAAPAFDFTFPGGRLPLVSELPDPPLGLERGELRRYILIGRTPSTLICLDLAADAHVVQILPADDAGDAEIQFVNSSLPQFAACLVAYRECLGEAIADDKRATQRAVDAAVQYSAMSSSERAKLDERLRADPGAVARAMEAEEAEAERRLTGLEQELRRIDAPALEEEAFWSRAIDALRT
jgi:hypothetical protein